ncbi:MAG: squalene--hopene cyclase [Gammaproteobacteria bacterium]|nr:squalene--hopene cyclase [Gammaproteobacteria bacterium]
MSWRSVNPCGVEVTAAPDDDEPIAGFNSLEMSVRRALAGLVNERCASGQWCYEFEADCTIPAEFLLMIHFMDDFALLDEIAPDLEQAIARFIRAQQSGTHGGWALYHGGDLDVSCSVKAYYALKLAGDAADAPHMRRAREAILARGGAAATNVFTHITLALFEQIPWRGVPVIPVEMMLAPRWFPFHLSKVSYWSRAVMVPLAILCSLKAKAKNPRRIGIPEIFTTPPFEERHWFPVRSFSNRLLIGLDAFARVLEPLIPGPLRRYAMGKALAWVSERIASADGLGAIFPAMVNAHEALAVAGVAADDPRRQRTREALKRLPVMRGDQAYVQPCVSPVWDTALACLAVHAAGPQEAVAVIGGLDWLAARQLGDEPGDWRDARPDLPGGGWPFQYDNAYYPDIDDTAAVGWAMYLADLDRYGDNIRRAARWVAGMQSRNGGFAAFDVDNTHYYLNEIPFADHGALLDPPTADVTARCLGFLSLVDKEGYRSIINDAIDYLEREQEADGSWFGRWGTNYIYGTWSVLMSFELAGVPVQRPSVRQAVQWLLARQCSDGGWGESNDSYLDPVLAGTGANSTSFQTAWALLGLMAAGETGHDAVRRGIDRLRQTQRADGLWFEKDFTAPGFPRVFYLKYHGYSRYFPLWAMARYMRDAAAP